MLPFSRQKKISRDLSIGLVFGWRGAERRSFTWLLPSLFVVAFFAALMSFVSISSRSVARIQNISSQVVLLPSTHSLFIKGERMSPFPSKWDPYISGQATSRVRRVMLDELHDSIAPQLQWKELPDEAAIAELPSVLQRGRLIMPVLFKEEREGSERRVKQVVVTFAGSSTLNSRILEANIVYPKKISSELFGVELRWVIGVNSKGKIEHCVPLNRVTGEDFEVLEQWLRTIKFEEGERVMGQLTLTVHAEL